jgi:hypothetical protein
MMREAKLLDKYSMVLLLLQLEKLRKIALAEGEILFTEMTNLDPHGKNRGPIETEAVALLANNRSFIND